MELSIHSLASGIDTVWVLLCAALVFLMEGGFAALEAGFIRSKNSLNIIMKVIMDCTVGMIGYFAFGFAFMYGLDKAGFIGFSGFFLNGDMTHLGLKIPVYAYWLFQAAFAIAMATIVSGAVAERMKFAPYIVFSFLATVIIYPVAGHWVWSGDGWLNKLGMMDFAGSAVVHSLGGWASLAAVYVLGPRTGKFAKDGSVNVIPGHNLPLAALGAFFLWFGWFGFNPGSTLSGLDMNIARIAVNTNIAAAAGGTMAALYTAFRYGKADPSMTINGALGGLVAITAGCAFVEPVSALIIGGIAGVLIVFAVAFFDSVRADDPVGAIAVHGVCGTFGTIAVGIFAENGGLLYGGGVGLLGVQALGVIAVSVWGFAATYGLFSLLKAIVGIRVAVEEEIEGLDISEHGITAYNDLEYNPMPTLGHTVNTAGTVMTVENRLAE
ncbi:MAG TPA: ammonium transporter [Methylomusa anaerophila]|uniref:Ammonium transporter n=1 Tax=Methylomusa anaerophila TaxID=1930071 RepID=A0A348AMN3_9FIRM|nr:ammonium transporter [Methylomusa anaerophila]BBB92331.1 ammonium transporter NrgA [Methylomusa anaerophila]HML90029.1 ammonium transporter [Methylomusa anaerophila]